MAADVSVWCLRNAHYDPRSYFLFLTKGKALLGAVCSGCSPKHTTTFQLNKHKSHIDNKVATPRLLPRLNWRVIRAITYRYLIADRKRDKMPDSAACIMKSRQDGSKSLLMYFFLIVDKCSKGARLIWGLLVNSRCLSRGNCYRKPQFNPFKTRDPCSAFWPCVWPHVRVFWTVSYRAI